MLISLTNGATTVNDTETITGAILLVDMVMIGTKIGENLKTMQLIKEKMLVCALNVDVLVIQISIKVFL